MSAFTIHIAVNFMRVSGISVVVVSSFVIMYVLVIGRCCVYSVLLLLFYGDERVFIHVHEVPDT